ncbi:MAG: hypothetical protein NVS4B11_13800 [Ktedonobacteraceae bacterium]
MSVADNTHKTPNTQESIAQIHLLFSQLEPQQIETFYQNYHYWHLQQQAAIQQEQLATIEQYIVDNTVLMQLIQPSPIALATLTRLQSYGVHDIDLLDTMLERGDTWLDHTLQLLEHCERLDFIHDNYTAWCQHALEGAYDWLDSISETEAPQEEQPLQAQVTQGEVSDDTTEALLIQRLMSEDETIKVPSVGTTSSHPSLGLITNEGRNEAVPTGGSSQRSFMLPTILSYAMKEDTLPAPTAPIRTIPSEVKQQRTPKLGLVARIMAKVWQT